MKSSFSQYEILISFINFVFNFLCDLRIWFLCGINLISEHFLYFINLVLKSISNSVFDTSPSTTLSSFQCIHPFATSKPKPLYSPHNSLCCFIFAPCHYSICSALSIKQQHCLITLQTTSLCKTSPNESHHSSPFPKKKRAPSFLEMLRPNPFIIARPFNRASTTHPASPFLHYHPSIASPPPNSTQSVIPSVATLLAFF